MSAKLKTSTQFYDAIDANFSWRLQEISTIKMMVKGSCEPESIVLIRSGVPLLYAHWEGFVKTSSEMLLEYISNQRNKLCDLRPCFAALSMRQHLRRLVGSGSSREASEAMSFILNCMGQRARISYKGVIDTESNLSSTVLQNIVNAIGMDISSYEDSFPIIDTSLLRTRNHIAHGEYLEIGKNRYTSLSDSVVGLIRQFKNDAQNIAIQKSYIKSSDVN